jgi:hypothetical protein
MLTYKLDESKRTTSLSDGLVCLFSVCPGVSRTFLLIAGTDNKRSNKCNKKYNSDLFHSDSIIIIPQKYTFHSKNNIYARNNVSPHTF